MDDVAARPVAGSDAAAHHHAQGLIGPNAILRVAEALAITEREPVFRAAGLLHRLRTPPDAMVPDDEVAALHRALHATLGPARALAIGAEAGRLTARYLLAHRIPPMAQRLLPWLPSRLALSILMRAIGRHAWTFAGAGRFSWYLSPEPGFSIAGGPVARHLAAHEPVCAYYAATFATILQRVVDRRITVIETACEARGDRACTFAIRLGQRRSSSAGPD